MLLQLATAAAAGSFAFLSTDVMISMIEAFPASAVAVGSEMPVSAVDDRWRKETMFV